MKKFFSAILLMTMMVFSVGTFVSCNDLVNEIEGVKTQTTELEAAIAELEGDLATLETALQNAKKEAADAAAAADANAKDAAAAAAAAQAKVDAVEKALAEAKATLETALAGKADKADVDAAVKDIEALQTALAGKADATDVEALKKQAELLEATLAEYKTLLDNLGLEDKKLQDAYADLEARLQQTLSDMQAADEANAEAIADLVKDLEEAVAAVNENLVSYDDTLKAIVDMIQSVVYVPEYADGEMTATGYVLGNKASDIIVKATYEVTPAAAAAELTNANLKFQAVNVATRAAAAETVAAELVEPAANGRVTVYARIKKGQNIYKQLTSNNKAALALVVTDQESVVIDSTDYAAGTNYKTAYTTVRPYDADSFVELNTLVKSYNNVTGKWVKGEQVYGVYDNVNTLQVPYTDTEVKSPLAIYELRADIQGKAMTIAEAAAFVGYDLKVKPAAETIEYLVADSKPQPFKVVPGNFATTVQLVGREGNELKDFAEAGYGVTVTIPSYTVNDAACAAVPVSGTVIITYAKDSDITFESYDAGAWSYQYYKNGVHAYVKNSPVCELDVTSNVNIRDLYYNTTKLNDGAVFTVPMTAVYFDKYNQMQFSTGSATFKVLNSKSVMLNAINLPIIDQALTYTANFTLKDKNEKLNYTASFTATVGARPADKEISLGDLTYTGMINDGVAKNVNAISLVTGVDGAYYSDILSMKPAEALSVIATEFAKTTAHKHEGDAKLENIGYTNKGAETAQVTVAKGKVTAYGTKYDVKTIVPFFGVNYTFVGSITVNKPNYGIKASSLLINPSTMVGDVAGKVVYPAKATGTNVSAGSFTLQAIDLRDYVVVTENGANAVEDLLNSGEFKLMYELISYYDPTPWDPTNNDTYTPIPGVTFAGESTTRLAAENIVTWAKNNGYASAKFRVTLVANNGAKVETPYGLVADNFGSVEFTLQIPDLVTMAPTSKVETKEFVPGVDQVAIINVYKSITVVDFNGTKLVGKKAKSLTTLWDETEDGNQFHMYGQSVIVINNPREAVPTAVVESTGDALYYGKDFEVNTTTGDVKLLATDLNIQSNVVVTVPLKLTHDYQDATDQHVVSVQVKFTPKK